MLAQVQKDYCKALATQQVIEEELGKNTQEWLNAHDELLKAENNLLRWGQDICEKSSLWPQMKLAFDGKHLPKIRAKLIDLMIKLDASTIPAKDA